jgi:hypothetical protein
MDKIRSDVSTAAKKKLVEAAANTKLIEAAANKKLVEAANKYNPFGTSGSDTFDVINPAMKKYSSDLVSKGIAPDVANWMKQKVLKTAPMGAFDVPLTKPEIEVKGKPVGGKKTRKLPKGAKGFMVRRVCAISLVPVGIKTRRRKH